MYRLIELLGADQIARLAQLASSATWIDGRISNPTNKGKNNEQIEAGTARDESGAMIADALGANSDFNDYAMPVAMAVPLLSRYSPGMSYALHGDNAYLHLGSITIRNDLACTIFLADPASYDGSALVIHSGDVKAAFTFIQSRIADPAKRRAVAELGAIARSERERLDPAAHARLLVVHQNLLREWGDAP